MNLQTLLGKNRPLKNMHAGKRCFIVGNGPSLKAQDLRLLANETTIAVSRFHLHPDLTTINPDYWLLADPAFWQEPDETLYPILQGINDAGLTPKLFMPTGAAPLLSNLTGMLGITPHFFQFNFSKTELEDLDFCSDLPPFGQTVVIPALMLALYLGCNPIYLLGCDHDWFQWTAESYATAAFDHFYDPKHFRYKSHQERFSFEDIQRVVGIMRFQYGQLHAYAQRNGVQVFNATHGGHLDIFPRIAYDTLFTQPPGGLSAAGAGELALHPLELGQTALSLIQEGKLQAGLTLVDKAISLNNRPDRIEGLAAIKALCLAKLGYVKQAIVLARQAVAETASPHPAAPRLLAQLEPLLTAASLAEEEEIAGLTLPSDVLRTRALETDEREAESTRHTNRGEQLFASGRMLEATQAFLQAAALAPHSPLPHNNLGVTYWQLGEPQRARHHFMRALEIAPNNPDALENLDALDASLREPAQQ